MWGKKMKKTRTYAVLGLGRFGFTLAKELSQMNQDVIAIDKDIENVEKADEFATSFALDFSDAEALKEVGVGDADVAIVATSASLEETILAVLTLKELNIPRIICKAKDTKYAEVLKKIGADVTILPESEMARRLALKEGSQNNVLELYDLGGDCLVYEMKVKEEWVGQSLIELNLRNKYSINVIGFKEGEKLSLIVDPQRKFQENDAILVVSNQEALKLLNTTK